MAVPAGHREAGGQAGRHGQGRGELLVSAWSASLAGSPASSKPCNTPPLQHQPRYDSLHATTPTITLNLPANLQLGVCGAACKTLEAAADDILASHDTDIAEALYTVRGLGFRRAVGVDWQAGMRSGRALIPCLQGTVHRG